VRPHRLDDLRNRRCDVVQPPGEDPHLAAGLVDLDARPVQLELERRIAHPAESLVQVLGRLREHRLHRTEQLDPVAVQPGASFD